MATIQLRRGGTTDRLAITPAVGEPCWDTDTNRFFVGDGTTAGGVEVAAGGINQIDGGNIADSYVGNPFDIDGGIL